MVYWTDKGDPGISKVPGLCSVMRLRELQLWIWSVRGLGKAQKTKRGNGVVVVEIKLRP